MIKGKERICEKDEALGNLIRLFHSGGVGIKIFPHVTRISFFFLLSVAQICSYCCTCCTAK